MFFYESFSRNHVVVHGLSTVENGDFCITANGFKEFLTRLRIDKGCELLETTNYSITKIAELVGFSTDNHFSTTFKSLHNITPKEYRNLYKIRNNTQISNQ